MTLKNYVDEFDMNLKKSVDKSTTGAVCDDVPMAFEKCYTYAVTPHDSFPDEYRMNYERITEGIEQMKCAENVRTVMRLRYRYGHKFIDISRLLGITYQWVHELHKKGVSLLEKHLSL